MGDLVLRCLHSRAIALAEGTEQDMAAELHRRKCQPRHTPPGSPHAPAKRTRMSPIGQPLMLMELLGRRKQDVARRILEREWQAGCSAELQAGELVSWS